MPQLATFTLDGRLYGLDVRTVQEVLRDQVLTPVPLAPPAVRGLLNLRGQILAAIDLRVALGGKASDVDVDAQTGSVVILQTPQEPISLLVDSFGDVVSVTPETFEPCDSLLDGVASELVLGAYRLDAALLHVLDPAGLTKRVFAG